MNDGTRQHEIVKDYMSAFAQKDLKRIRRILTDDIILKDSLTKTIKGINQVVDFYHELFKDNEFELNLKQSFNAPPKHFAQEFSLAIIDAQGQKTLVEGIDCFEFQGNKICSIRAYIEVHLE